MISIKPREPMLKTIFLAGSIDLGAVGDWQSTFEKALEPYDNLVCLNPRIRDWDKKWFDEDGAVDRIANWEMNGMDKADLIIMYIDPASKAPITLLELGLYSSSNKLVVCCPDGFWRKGNVDAVCKRFNIPTVRDLDELISYAKTYLELYK